MAKSAWLKLCPKAYPPGSDSANLSVMGYDPRKFYTGRSPLEAVSMGIELSETDVTYRCNLVTLSDGGSYSEKTMIDYSSDEISSAEAREIIQDVNRHFQVAEYNILSGNQLQALHGMEERPDRSGPDASA